MEKLLEWVKSWKFMQALYKTTLGKKLIDTFLNKEVVNYLIFGVLTTIVNIAVYYAMTWGKTVEDLATSEMLLANFVAWVAGVTFAYITNKLFVFESKTETKKEFFKELVSFVWFRVLSLILDMGVMFVTVDIMKLNDKVMKIVSNVLVVIANYIFSKLFIFNKEKNKKG